MRARDRASTRPRLLLVTSPGGVLLDLLALRPWWSERDASWVAVRAADTVPALTGERVLWVREPMASRPVGLVVATLDAVRRLRRDRPDLVVSAGTAVAVPYFVAARLLGVPTVWVSTLNLVASAGLAARVCSRLATRVLVQRPSMLRVHPGARLVGSLY
jgi:nitroreductase